MKTVWAKFRKLLSRKVVTNGLGDTSDNLIYSERRKAGKFTKDGVLYERQKVLRNKILGKKAFASFSIDLKQPIIYGIMEATDLQPSHIGKIENPLHFLPEAQPRNRAASESGAVTPEIIAQKLYPPEITED